MKKIIIGIDPGKNGGVSVLTDNGVVSLLPMPKIGSEFDIGMFVENIQDIKRLFSEYNIYAFVEDVHAIHGSSAKSTFSFGENVGVIKATLTAAKIRYIMVQPKVWQNKSWIGIRPQTKMVKNRKKVDTKKTSLIAAKRLFPDVSFLATERSKVPHDGLVDAALIGWYGLNFYLEGDV